MAASPETLPGNPGGSIIVASAAACYSKHYVPARGISPEVAVSVHQSKQFQCISLDRVRRIESTFALSRRVEGTEVTGAHNQSRVQPWDTRERAGQDVSCENTYLLSRIKPQGARPVLLNKKEKPKTKRPRFVTYHP